MEEKVCGRLLFDETCSYCQYDASDTDDSVITALQRKAGRMNEI